MESIRCEAIRVVKVVIPHLQDSSVLVYWFYKIVDYDVM